MATAPDVGAQSIPSTHPSPTSASLSYRPRPLRTRRKVQTSPGVRRRPSEGARLVDWPHTLRTHRGSSPTWRPSAPTADPAPLEQGPPQAHGIEDARSCARESRVPGGNLRSAPPCAEGAGSDRQQPQDPPPTRTRAHTGSDTHIHTISHACRVQCRILEGRHVPPTTTRADAWELAKNVRGAG